jgi:hypothetical protein
MTLYLIIKLGKTPFSLKTPLNKAYDAENSPAVILCDPLTHLPHQAFKFLLIFRTCLKYQRSSNHLEITNSKSINQHIITRKWQTINALLSHQVSWKLCSGWQVIALYVFFSNQIFVLHIVHIPTRSKKLRSSWKLRNLHTKRFCKNLAVMALTKLLSPYGNVEIKIYFGIDVEKWTTRSHFSLKNRRI